MSLHHNGIDFTTMVRYPGTVQGGGGIIFHTFVVNIPQLVLSVVHFAYNSLFTSIFEDMEWHSYSPKPISLRVSDQPTGSQRGTHFLQLPYRIALPLIVVSGVVNWLVSQAIFLVDIRVFLLPVCQLTNCDQLSNAQATVPIHYTTAQLSINPTLGSTDSEIITCGFSMGAMLAIVCVEMLLVIIAVLAGYWRLEDTGQPVVGSCSAAISAACHPAEDAKKIGMSLEKLQWGVVSVDEVNEIGHCAFSSEEVAKIDPAYLYSGK